MSTATSFVSTTDVGIKRRLLLSILFRWACRCAVYSAMLVLATVLAVILWLRIRLGQKRYF